MKKNKTIDQNNVVTFSKAIANEDRLKIVQKLKQKEPGDTKELRTGFFMGQSTFSHHLNILQRANILKRRKNGRDVIYSVDMDGIKDGLDAISDLLLQR